MSSDATYIFDFFFFVVPHPTVTISRSRDGAVYAGTTFQLRVDIYFNNLTMDIAVDISWKRWNYITGNTVISNDDHTTVSAVSGSGDSYTASLTYLLITVLDGGNITATVTVSLSSSDSSCVQTKASETKQLIVEGI